MKRFFTLSIFCLVMSSLFAQDFFEGSITYQYSYQSLYKFITTDYIQKTFPLGERKTYKGSKILVETWYKERTDTLKTIYDLDKQKAFTIDPQSDTIRQTPINQPPGRLLQKEKVSMTKEVMGKKCAAVHLAYIVDMYRGKKVEAVYYYAPSLALNPVQYQGFQVDYMNLYAEMTGAIPLASSMSIEKLYRVDGVATDIQQKEVADTVFALPEGKVMYPR
ncbi:MAG: hypothetical protein AAF206_25045 [Bacteroidota bacterium]